MQSTPSGSASGYGAPSGYKMRSVPNFTPEQMQLFQSLLGGAQSGSMGGLDYLSKLASGDEDTFNQIEAPAFKNFEKMLGQTSSRFSQFGARNSSAFENAVAGQGADLASQLQSQRSGLQSDAATKLLGFSSDLLGQRPQENILQPKKQGFDWSQLLNLLVGAGSKAVGM